MLIALLGAESTGKTVLAQALADRLARRTGLRCVAVGEYLREWCDREGRTPRPDEQTGIADEQARRIAEAAQANDIVVADTTPLMIAVYSDLLFDDRSLYPMAIACQHRFRLNLLTALDLPWVADGLQRDGEHVREPVDAAIRRALMDAGIAWSVIAGQGGARLDAAFACAALALQGRRRRQTGLFSGLGQRGGASMWICEHCDVPECEHRSQETGTAAGSAAGSTADTAAATGSSPAKAAGRAPR
jgi:nicotinamide riboside kinase